MKLTDLYAKYMRAQALTDKELAEFHTKLSKLVELLFGMGFTLDDPMFAKINSALRDAHHMVQSRKQASKKRSKP
jgi:hypothetical protein